LLREIKINTKIRKVVMKKKLFIILILCTCNTIISFACLNAYQFKIFPVGVADDKIVTVDFKIHRADNWPDDEFGMQWFLYAYISTYEQNQKLIKATPFDSVNVKSDNYLEKLKEVYDVAFAKIQKDFPSIELFMPKYISFCDFQKKCKLLEVDIRINYDEDIGLSIDTATVKYRNKKYELNILKDSLYYGFNGVREYYQTPNEISSYRIYETKKIKLIAFHLAAGDLILYRAAGMIDLDEKDIPSGKEYKPNLKFKDIKKSVYEEPLLHHGYGFDAFIIE